MCSSRLCEQSGRRREAAAGISSTGGDDEPLVTASADESVGRTLRWPDCRNPACCVHVWAPSPRLSPFA
ncbi:hypothetical protein GN956_G4491 [Arapaima gigas]